MTGWLYLQLLMLAGTLAVISLVDLKTQTIPDLALIVLAGSGLTSAVFASSLPASVSGAAFYFCCFWLIRKVHFLATGRVGLGFGDVKMAGAAGTWLTIAAAPLFIGVASCLALLVAGILVVLSDRPILTRRIPFGPFLATSLFLCWLAQASNLKLDDFYDVLSFA